MTYSLYWQCAGMYLLGQFLHFFLIKVPAVKARSKAANKEFSLGDYLKDDWHIIGANQILGICLLIGLDQLINWKPGMLEYIKWFFAFVGFTGSVAIMAKFSKYETKLLNVIDVKTNISDSVMPLTDKQAQRIGEDIKDKDEQVSTALQKSKE